MDELLAGDLALQLPLSYLELYPYPAFIFSSSSDGGNAFASSSAIPYHSHDAPDPRAPHKSDGSSIDQLPRLPILWQNNRWTQDYGHLGSGSGTTGVTFEEALDSTQTDSVRIWLQGGSKAEEAVDSGHWQNGASSGHRLSGRILEVGEGGDVQQHDDRTSHPANMARSPEDRSIDVYASRRNSGQSFGAIKRMRSKVDDMTAPEVIAIKPGGTTPPSNQQSLPGGLRSPGLSKVNHSAGAGSFFGQAQNAAGQASGLPSRASTLSTQRLSIASSGDGRSRAAGSTHWQAAAGSLSSPSHGGTTLTLLLELGSKAFIVDLVKTTPAPMQSTPGLAERPPLGIVIVQSFIREGPPPPASGLGIGMGSKSWSRRGPPRQRVMDSYTVSHISPFQDPGKRYLAYPEAVAQQKALSDRTFSSAGGTSHASPSQAGAIFPALTEPSTMEAGDGESGIQEDDEDDLDTPGPLLTALQNGSPPIAPKLGPRSSISIGSHSAHGMADRAPRALSRSSVGNHNARQSRRSGRSAASMSAGGSSTQRSERGIDIEMEPDRSSISWLVENFDWSTSPLGPKAEWPQWIHATLSLVIANPGPSCLWLGDDLVMLFNEAYVHLAPNGVQSFGTRAKDSWSPELYAGLEKLFNGMHSDSFRREDDLWLLPSASHYTQEETYHSFIMIRLIVEGKSMGFFNSSTETTVPYLLSRRNQLLSEVTRTTALSRTRSEFFAGIAAAVETPEATRDIPYLAIYDVKSDGDLETTVNEFSLKVADHELDVTLRLESIVGVPEQHATLPAEKRLKLSRREMRKMGLGLEAAAASKLLTGPLSEDGSRTASTVSHEAAPASEWPLTEALTTGRVVHVEDATSLISGFEVRIWEDLPKEALVVPIIPKGSRLPTALLVVGINRRRPFDEEHKVWIELLRSNLSSGLAAVSSLETETLQKEKAQALTKSMDSFFGSAAHELRAPLTLCIGPITDLAQYVHDNRGRSLLTLATRNVLRLQRLVSSLMDYSKLDAGREKVKFRLTDVAEITTELVLAFQSFPTVEREQVKLHMDIDPMPKDEAAVWVDPALWERIVTNLCSNAVKYTPRGDVFVSLHYTDSSCILSVTDTGIGIPLSDLPFVSERFYRVSGSEAVAEGSGIGLAYCQELVRLHGGTMQIDSQTASESVDGTHGSTFEVILPLGNDHLDRNALVYDDDYEREKSYGRAIVEDAATWQREQEVESSAGDSSETGNSSGNDSKGLDPATLFFDRAQDVILIVDDNADMRQYIASLFDSLATVILARDGVEALEIARHRFPSLIISDINMPRMTGTELLAALRKESSELAFIPVVLLTAKAGEDDQIDGLLAGADDYLPKPFKSRELIARVNVQIQIGKKRKQLERLFARRTAELSVIAKYSPIGIVRAATDGQLTWVNDAWFDQSGYEPRTLPIADWGPFCMPEDLPRLSREWMDFVNDPTVKQVSLNWRWKNGRFMDSTFVRLNRINPHLDGYVGCVIDLTYQKQKEQEQELLIIEETRRREAAVAARQQQELLIDVTSHELRNPVSAIIQSSLVVAQDLQSLRSGLQSHIDGGPSFSPNKDTLHLVDEAIDSMDSIYQCGQSMTAVSNDILALGRIQLDMLQVYPVATDLAKEVPKILSIFRTETKKLEIDLKLVMGSGVRGISTVQTDPVRLGQIIHNLTTNAIRFTATSTIRKITVKIDVSTTAPNAGDCLMPASTLPTGSEPLDSPIWIYCQVEDTGPGLAPESLQLLFKRFSQATSETHVQFGGSGLGLFVCRKLCDLLGGKIEISSQFGVGSTFRFVIKAGTSAPLPSGSSFAAATASRAPRVTTARKLNVAVVEDNAINSKLLKRQLTGAGHTVAVAFNGEEGLALMRQENYRRFDVVVMDIEMPVMDGLTAIRTIRREERELGVPRQQVVALTGNAREAQKQAALDAGYDDVVIKPYKLDSLLQVLEEWARKDVNVA